MDAYIKKLKAKSVQTGLETIYDVYDEEALHDGGIVDNHITTDPGYILDGRQGSELARLAKKVYANIEEMRANFTRDIGICYVTCDNSTFGQGDQGNYYQYVPEIEFAEEPLANGGCARLIIPEFRPLRGKTGDEILPMLMKVAYSYCGSNVPYKSNSGPFFVEEKWHHGIQCSMFVNSMLYGLPYEQSKIANESNANACEFGGTGVILQTNTKIYTFASTNPKYAYLSANEMAHYAAAHGWFKKTKYMVDAQIGDVLHFHDFGSPTQKLVNWKGIGHVGIVVGRLGTAVMYAQSGGTLDPGHFSPKMFKPGPSSDGVNFQFVPDATKPFYNEEKQAGLYGISRFPMFFNDVKPIREYEPDDFTGTYTAGQSNITRYFTRTADNIGFKYGILKFSGYTSLKGSNAGLFASTQTVNSSYGGDMTTIWNDSYNDITGGVMPILAKKDGSSKAVQSLIAIRCSEASASDSYKITDMSLKLYS